MEGSTNFMSLSPLAFLIPPLSAPSLSLNAHGFKKEWSTQTVTPPSLSLHLSPRSK